jgi:hypothetical protein
MEFRSWSASGMSPGTDTAALRLITTAVVVGLVMSGVALASGWGLVANGPQAQRAAASPPSPAELAGLTLLSQAAQACRSISYQGV